MGDTERARRIVYILAKAAKSNGHDKAAQPEGKDDAMGGE